MRLGLVLNNWGIWGGSSVYHYNLIKGLQAKGIDCVVGLPFNREAWELPKDISFHQGVENTVKMLQGCDTWLFWGVGSKTSIKQFLMRRRTKPKVISISHGSGDNPWCIKCFAKEAPYSDKIVVVSDNGIDAVPVEYRDRVTTIEGPINRDRLKPFISKKKMLESLGLTEDSKILLYLGRLDPAKRYELIIEATRYLPKEWHTLIVGSGIAHIMPHSLFQNFRVKFCGPTATPGDYIQLASCSASLSLTEGFGLSVVETMTQGVPTLTHKVGIMKHLDIGYIVPTNWTAKQYAQAIVEADRNREKALQDQQTLTNMFTVETFIKKWLTVLS